MSGSGIQNTRTFTVPASWQVQYSFDCSSFGTSGNFIVSVYNVDGSPSLDNIADVNRLSLSGNGTQYYYVGGTYYLSVNSECDWSIAVAAGQ